MRASVVFVIALAACASHRTGADLHPAREAPVKLVYQRSGGFAGFLDRMEIEGDRLTLTRRRKQVLEQTLPAGEAQTLQELAAAAQEAPAPGVIGAPGADTFQFSVYVGEVTTPQLTLYGHGGSPEGLGPAWAPLVQELQSLFQKALSSR